MKGSITIEAVLVISLCVLILAWIMGKTINLYEEVRETAKEAAVENFEPVEWFYTSHFFEQAADQEGSD